MASATVKMSLSPRPQIHDDQMVARQAGAILTTWASACAGSSAGRMPSSSLHRRGAERLLVGDRHVLDRPMSFSQACSGPTPG